MSRGFPSHKRITQKEYEIVKDGEGAIIKNGDWESIVLPGVQIAISILIKYSTPHSRLGVKRCPRCNASYSSAKIIKSSLKWYISHLQLQKIIRRHNIILIKFIHLKAVYVALFFGQSIVIESWNYQNLPLHKPIQCIPTGR